MSSNHFCKNFTPILTPEAELICSNCGMVLEEKVEIQYLTGMQPKSPSILVCDEARHGSGNIAPDGFAGEGKTKLNTINIRILSARQKPLRMLFTNTCKALGLSVDYSRTALNYYDTLHEIRSKLKTNVSLVNNFSKIIKSLQKSKALTESNILNEMTCSKYWSTHTHAREWIKNTIGDNISFETFSKIKKPKKLSTLNISFFSIYQVVCDNNMRTTKKQIVMRIAKHMKFTRPIKTESAMSVCKTVLSIEKNNQLVTPTVRHDVLLESNVLGTDKMKYVYHVLSNDIPSKKNAERVTKELESMQ